jgi:hypothetical protein
MPQDKRIYFTESIFFNFFKSFQTSYKSKSLTHFLRKQKKKIRIGIEGLIKYRGRTPAANFRLN